MNQVANYAKVQQTGAIIYADNGYVKRVNNCAGYIATNVGGDVCSVNGHILYPGNATLLPGGTNGDSLEVNMEECQVFMGTIQIVFFGVGGNPQVSVDQLQYIY